MDAQARDADASRSIARIKSRLARRAARTEAPAEAVGSLADRLTESRRPALIIGGRHGAVSRQAVERFAHAFGAVVFTTSRRKGLVDSSLPYFAGTFLNGNIEGAFLNQSDLVVLVDAEAFDFYNRPWGFAAEPVVLTSGDYSDWINPVADVIVGDPDAVLTDLTGSAAAHLSDWKVEEIAAFRESLRDVLADADGTSLSVGKAVATALEAWPKDNFIVVDAGFSKPIVAMLSDPAAPDLFLASNALSTMGYSIPAALAVRQSRKEPILVFLGDGSLLMRALELLAAAETTGPMVVVAIMDQSLTQIEVKQERRNLRSVGVGLPTVDCSSLAAALRIQGTDVSTADELSAAVLKGLTSAGPLLIGAHVDPAPSRDLFELLRG
jgi:acetolactate synthase I/II/III large subunit